MVNASSDYYQLEVEIRTLKKRLNELLGDDISHDSKTCPYCKEVMKTAVSYDSLESFSKELRQSSNEGREFIHTADQQESKPVDDVE